MGLSIGLTFEASLGDVRKLLLCGSVRSKVYPISLIDRLGSVSSYTSTQFAEAMRSMGDLPMTLISISVLIGLKKEKYVPLSR